MPFRCRGPRSGLGGGRRCPIPVLNASFVALSLLLGCAGDGADSGDAAAAPQPLDLPADPAATGVPVGVRTVVVGDGDDAVTLEVWYPADEAHRGQAGDPVDLSEFLPAAFVEHVGEVSLPPLQSIAVRDAALRPPEAPYPMVLFSHGLGGFRSQSVDVTAHLASRGYVVVGVDHPGRMMPDILPCLFSPALDGCDISGVAGGGAEELEAILAWIDGEPDWLAGAVDASAVGVMGHSAGAGTTTRFAEEDDRIAALVPMAGGSAVDGLPTLFMGGTCDPYPGMESITASFEGSDDARLVAVQGAGHLAFSDLCELDLGGLADEVLAGRTDLNATYYDLLLDLATDGCPGGSPDPEQVPGCTEYLDLDTSDPIVRHYATAFLDQTLRGTGDGVQAGVFSEAEVR